MRSSLNPTVLLATVFWMILAIPSRGQTMSWEDCVKTATLNNPSLVASHESLRSYEAQYGGSYSSYFPQISASTGGNYEHKAFILHQYSANVTVSQTVFNGGLTQGQVAQAGASYRAGVAALALQKSLVSYDLRSAFAQLLYAQELVTLTGQIMAQRRSDADEIHLKYDGGRENKGAYLLSESDYQQAVLDYHNAKRNVVVSQHQLAQIMGIRVTKPILVTGQLEIPPLDSADPDFNKLAVETPTHFEQLYQTSAARAGITIARSGFLPTVSLDASLDRSGQRFFPKPNTWSGGFSVSLPVFTGGQTYFNVQAAEASLRQSLANLQSSDDSTVYNLAQSYANLQGDIEAVSVNHLTVEAQKVRSEIGSGQYSNGLISFTDFNLIEDDLVNAENAELQSRRDAVIAEANWEYSQGKGVIP